MGNRTNFSYQYAGFSFVLAFKPNTPICAPTMCRIRRECELTNKEAFAIKRVPATYAERYLVHNYMQQIMYPNSVNVPLLLGGPGIGKSAITAQALVRLVDLLTMHFVRRVEGLENFEDLVRAELEALDADMKSVEPVLKAKIGRLHNVIEEMRLKRTKFYAEMAEDYKAVEIALSNKNLKLREEKVPRMFAKAVLVEASKPGSTVGTVVKFDSSLPMEAYEDSAVYVMLNMGLARPETFGGIPYVSKESGADIIPPSWAVAVAKSTIGVVNLDEFTNRSPEAVQTLAYAVTLVKQAGTFYFGPTADRGGIVVATGNTRTTSSLVAPLPGPLFAGRVQQIVVEPSPVERWIEYMNRKHGSKWFKPIGVILRMFSTYSNTYKELAEGELRNLVENMRKYLAGPFADPYYPPDDIIRQFSKILPGEKPNFPSPRTWEHISVQTYYNYVLYKNTGSGLFIQQIRNDIDSMAMKAMGVVVASMAEALAKGSEVSVFNFKELVDNLQAILNSDVEEAVNKITEILSKTISAVMQLNIEVLSVIRKMRRGEPLNSHDQQVLNEARKITSIYSADVRKLSYCRSRLIYCRMAQILLRSVVDTITKDILLVATMKGFVQPSDFGF